MGVLLGFLIGVSAALVGGIPVLIVHTRRQARRARIAERRARNAERMAEIGALTGGLAHEIKNPLSTIGLNAQLLGEAIEELDIDEQERSRLVRRTGVLRREADRLGDILQDFLRYAGHLHLERRTSDLNEVVLELVDFFLPQVQDGGIALRTELGPGPMRADLDVQRFKQAVLNLLINAVQAMERRAGDDAPGGPREIILRTHPDTGEHGPEWALHVIDTGPGIPEERLGKIFTPYFTTKSGGSGLGLATAKRLIEEHGGRMDVHSEVGKGSDFVIRVPRAMKQAG